MTGLLARKKRLWIALGVFVIACSLATAFVLTARSSADADQVAISALISDFQQAEVNASIIPGDSVNVVQTRLDSLSATMNRPTTDTDSSPVQILPAPVRERMNRATEARLQKYCSSAYQKLAANSTPLADVVEAGLYNNPQLPLLVEPQTELLAALVMKNDGQTAIVWAYSWGGDVTTTGKGGQSWRVVEYRVVKENGQWRVDGRSSLAVAESTSQPYQWGPYTPHTPLEDAEQEGTSVLYPSQMIPRDKLQALADMAVPDK